MEIIKGDYKVALLDEFTKDTGLKLCLDNRKQYVEWLEYRLVKNLPIQLVSNCACVNCDTIGNIEWVKVCGSCGKEY